MKEFKISIVIPIYLSEPFLEQALDSVVGQTYKNLEIILVNDGSPDNSLAICQKYQSGDNRIKIINQKNQGAAAALNKGIEAATGEYLIFLDADDWLDIETCSSAMAVIREFKTDVVFWSYIKEYENRSVPDTPIFRKDVLFEGRELEVLKRRMVGLVDKELNNPTRTDAINSGWGKLYKTAILKKYGKWEDTQKVGSSDVAFNISVFQYIRSAYFKRAFFSHYRKYNPNSLTLNYKMSLLPKYLNLFREIERIINDHNLGDVFKLALNNRIAVSCINHAITITNPDNGLSKRDQINYLSKVLNEPVYEQSLRDLDLTYLPLHWKWFFICCRYKWTSQVYFLGKIIRGLR